IGRMATILPGVRPSISFASRPTASTSPLVLLMATMEGSLTTMPLPLAKTRVFAVPRSIARSDDSRLKTDRKLYPFLLMIPILSRDPFEPRLPSRPQATPRISTFPDVQRSGLRNDDIHALDGCAAAAI